jgi:hypothetical protein
MATFRSALTQSDLIASASVSAIAGQFVQLGKRQIQAGELMSIGFGQQAGQADAQGRIFALLKNATSVTLNGIFRLTVYTPQMRPLMILGEWRTETLTAGQTSTATADRTKLTPLPESIYQLSEDKYLVLEFNSDTTDTVTKANCSILLDITEVQA